jgi:hypothetical protein
MIFVMYEFSSFSLSDHAIFVNNFAGGFNSNTGEWHQEFHGQSHGKRPQSFLVSHPYYLFIFIQMVI